MTEILSEDQCYEKILTLLMETTLDLFARTDSGLSLKENLAVQIIGERRFVRMTDLAGMLHLPLTTTSSMVDRLAANRIVVRSRFEDERRIVAVSLSPEGQEFWKRQKDEQFRRLKENAHIFSEDERQQLFTLIEKIP